MACLVAIMMSLIQGSWRRSDFSKVGAPSSPLLPPSGKGRGRFIQHARAT
jgi:hypothetical protein